MMNNYVFASDDDEYIQLTDFYTYSAYHYWEQYGYSADSSYTYTDTYTTIGSLSYNATISLTGSFSASESGDFSGQPLLEWHDMDGGYSIWIPKSLDMSIEPDTGQTGSQTVPTFACAYNPSATGATATMTCTPSGNSVFTQDTYTLELNTIGNDGSNGLFAYVRPSDLGQGTGSITISDSHPLTASFTISGSASNSGNLVGSGTINLSTTTINTNNLKLALPVMTCTSIDNSYRNNVYNAAKTLRNYPDDPVTIIYMADTTGINFSSTINLFDLYDSNNSNRLLNKKIYKHVGKKLSYLLIAESIYTDSISSGAEFFLKWKSPMPVPIIPIFVGYYANIPDDLYRWVFGEDRLIEFLEHGNTQSQSAANGMNQVEQDFVGKTDELIDFEGDTFNSMDSAIDGVQLNNNLISGSGFLNAANWVRVQFDNLISYSPLSSVLVFSLSLGFALLIIGKVR